MCILSPLRNCNGQNLAGFLYFHWTHCYFHDVKAEEFINILMISVVVISYYSMLWRIQPIAELKMGVSYVWVVSVVVCALVYLKCMGMESYVLLLHGIP